MDARQRIGAVMLAIGTALAIVGVIGLAMNLGGPAVAVASPTPAASAIATPGAPTDPPMSARPPTDSPSAAPTPDNQVLVRAFFLDLEAAIRTGGHEELLDRLGPAVLDRYGRPACSTNLSTRVAVPEQAFEILAIHPLAPWDYVTDELTTTIPDAITVDARVTGPDASGAITTADRELHVQLIDGTVYWFTDCGEPLT